MLYDRYFQNPKEISRLINKMKANVSKTGPIRLMEICGTHTMAIARSGIRSILPEGITLLSGPGCPVCVTPANMIDMVLDLSQRENVIVASYGDLLRVPGSRRGDSLLFRRAQGGSVKMVYSPVEAVEIARKHPGKEVVFLGVGFETTAPGTAACILEAAADGIDNFSVLCLLKRTEPALRTLIEADDFAVNGFLCPGHVATIIGAKGFSFLQDDYHLPGVVSGFEAGDLLFSILELTEMIATGRPELKNEYTRVVRPGGNPTAMAWIDKVFELGSSDWRGLGNIKNSGFHIRETYEHWDAVKKFSLVPGPEKEIPGCCCAQVICGVLSPSFCTLFGTVCTPENPTGPCMVSGEGACAAAYAYESEI